MENTPSLAMSLNRAPAASASLRRSSSSFMSELAKRYRLAFERRTPSMIEAWLRLSEMIASSPQQRLEHAAIGVETGGEHDRVRFPQVLGDRLLELTMQRLRPADEAYRSHAEAELIHRAARRRDDVGVIGEAKVIVGAEIDRIARALWRRAWMRPPCGPVSSRSRFVRPAPRCHRA